MNFFNFQEFFTPSYLFQRVPPTISKSWLMAGLVVAVLAVVAGIVMKVAPRLGLAKNPAWISWWRRVGSVKIGAGITAFLLVFFRYERVPVLASRFLALVWLIVLIVMGIKLLWQAYTIVPEKAAMASRQQRLQKYLP